MIKLNPKDFTLIVAKDIKKMLTILRRWKVDNSDLIQVVETEHLFYFNDIKHPDFYFFVGVPDKKSNGKPTMFPINYSPVHSDSKKATSGEVKMDDIIKNFNIWFDLIKDYNSVSFDNNQQIILYKFLETTITYLEKEYPDNKAIQEIIEEANTLKIDIPILSKRVASRRFSKVLAKIQKFNPITFKEVYEIAKKEVIKYLLLKSVETLPKIITNITHFIGG